MATNFISPIILKDGVQCTNCYNFTSLNAGTVMFNVSSWSNYSIFNDSVAPVINITSPQNATITNQTYQNFSLNISENSALGNATLRIYNQTGLYNMSFFFNLSIYVNFIKLKVTSI